MIMSLHLNSWVVHNIAQHHGDGVWKGLNVVIPPIPNYPTSKDMTNFAKFEARFTCSWEKPSMATFILIEE